MWRLDKRAEERLWHDDTVEEKSSAGAEMDESGEESTPRSAEPVADEKSERDRGAGRERHGEARGRGR